MSRTAAPLAATIAFVVGAAACGHSAGELRTARRASYDAPFATVWNVVMTEIRKKFNTVVLEDPVNGHVVTAWTRIENRDTEVSDPTTGAQSSVGVQRGASGLAATNMSITPGMIFRMSVQVKGAGKGAGPFRVIVDGEAADYRPGLANEGIVPIKHGAADEPPWVQNRIDNFTVEVYKQLEKYAVTTGNTPAAAPVAAKPHDDAPWANLPDRAAARLIDEVHAAAMTRDTAGLRRTMVDDFRWGLGADGSAETAIALWSADTSKLKDLARALEEGCGVEDATGEVVCPAAGAAKGPSMARFKKVGNDWKFVLFLAAK
jgi:hypothetical protein